jgi:hypothetical protein
MFTGAKVLASDLSLTGIRFARRQMRKCGATNLASAQADILYFDSRFDRTRCIGLISATWCGHRAFFESVLAANWRGAISEVRNWQRRLVRTPIHDRAIQTIPCGTSSELELRLSSPLR